MVGEFHNLAHLIAGKPIRNSQMLIGMLGEKQGATEGKSKI